MLDTTLSAEDQFNAEVAGIPRYSDEERYGLIQRACQGDMQARQEFIRSLVRFLIKPARSYASWCEHLSFLDIIQVGCETLLLLVDRSLWGENPIAYLIAAARTEMRRACSSHKGLISTPYDVNPVHFKSLDAPIHEDEGTYTLADVLQAPDSVPEERDTTALYQALAQLPENRRVLLARRYGLLGYTATPPYELAQEMYPALSAPLAYARLRSLEKKALLALQETLASAYLLEGQAIPEEFYTATEIREWYGVDSFQLRRWAMAGRLRRYPAPDGVRSRTVPYVYAKAEVDALLEKRQATSYQSGEEGHGQSSLVPLDARRPTPKGGHQALAGSESPTLRAKRQAPTEKRQRVESEEVA